MAEFVDGVFQLLRGQVRELKGGRSKGHEPVGMLADPGCEAFVVQAHNIGGQIPVGLVPPIAVDAQGLVVDAAFVHGVQAIGSEGLPGGKPDVRKIRILQNVGDLRKDAVRVYVHGGGALRTDKNLSSGGLGEGPRIRCEQQRAGGTARRRQKLSAICHGELLSGSFRGHWRPLCSDRDSCARPSV